MPEAFPAPATVRAAIGRTSRRARKTGDPGEVAKLDKLRSEHAAARIAEFVAKTVAEAPPLTLEQRDRLAALLRPTSGGDHLDAA